MKSKVLTVLLAVLSVAAKSENLIDEPENGRNYHALSFRVMPDEAPDGETMLKVTGGIYGIQWIKIDPAKKYRISVEAVAAGKDAVPHWIGVLPYDAKKRRIQSVNFHVQPDSGTVLAADCKIGDQLLLIKDGAKWRKKGGCVAFDVKEDFSDLPNFNLSKKIQEVKKLADGNYEVRLSAPLTFERKAGTPVRQHLGYGFFAYAGRSELKKDQLMKVEGTLNGFSLNRCENGKFWPGTVYVKFAFQNFQKQPFFFRNVRVTEEQ